MSDERRRMAGLMEEYRLRSEVVKDAFAALDRHRTISTPDYARMRLEAELSYAQRDLQAYVNSLSPDDAAYVVEYGGEE